MNIVRKHNSNKGTSTVEAIIILPLLVLMTFGGLKYGLLFLRAQQVTNVARQACRLAIRPGADNTLVNDEIDRLMAAIGFSTSDYSVSMPDVASVPLADDVTLAIILDTDSVDNLTLVNWLPLPPTITARITMCKEGPGSAI